MTENKCLKCEHFDCDDESGEEFCTMGLDEDELQRFLTARTSECPYFRYYDEYKMVRKQN